VVARVNRAAYGESPWKSSLELGRDRSDWGSPGRRRGPSDTILSGAADSTEYWSLEICRVAGAVHENFALFMNFSIHTQNAFYKWREGSLAQELWRGWEYVAMKIFSTSGGKDFWSERSYLFADAFQKFVSEGILTRSPHPQAKA